MKRILFFVLFCFLTFFCFSQEKNIILRETYPTQNISNIKIDLYSENLSISCYNGEDILIEVSSNNKNLKPEISIFNEQFNISKTQSIFNKGDNCTVFVYIPFNHEILNYYINTRFGSLSTENLTATDKIQISCECFPFYNSNLTCNYFSFTTSENIIHINQLSCSYFDIQMTAGSLEVSLKNAPLASSYCHIKNGDLKISLPRTDNFEIQAYTNLGTFINNFDKTIQTTKNYKSFQNGIDGAVIKLQSHSGNITIEP